ncbi:hypothetical protein ACIHCQ_19790 [Streptomyces sp. NPDC052236]|uniref:hypothetical protein n=1 Tax=Streptomyces sp. NPDC052236 TaxID=3365686 RepID=UPI0037D636EE
MAKFSAGVGFGTPASKLRMMSDEYVAQMYSIIEINRSIIPEMAVKDEELADQLRRRIVAQLTDSEREEYADYLEKIAATIFAAADQAEGRPKPGDNTSALSIEIQNGVIGSAIQRSIAEGMMRTRAGSSEELLRKSLLVSAISSFEVLFGQIARAIYSVNSSALNDSDYAFTLQELAKFSTLDDAREYLIERRISGLLRDSIDAWDKWLKRTSGGLSMDTLPVEWPLIRESFARRNLIVHTGGVVNHLYTTVIQKLDSPNADRITIGSRLTVDEEYLDRVLQELLALGHILTCATGSKLHKSEEENFASATVATIQNLSAKSAWRACSAVCKYALSRNLARSSEMNVRVRSWLSRKEIHGIESIRKEVEEWDTSGLSKGISHCKAVLLDDLDSALPEIDALLRMGELTKFELALDPLYDGVVGQLSIDQETS